MKDVRFEWTLLSGARREFFHEQLHCAVRYVTTMVYILCKSSDAKFTSYLVVTFISSECMSSMPL